MRRLLLSVGCFMLLLVPLAAASNQNTAPLHLTSETVQNSLNPAAPSWCLNEDDYDGRSFAGSLNGSYSTQFQLCDGNVDYSGGVSWTAGGEGIQSKVGVSGTLSDLTITAPDGTVTHGVYMSTDRHVSYYEVCVCPPFYASTDTGTDPLAGGIWTVTLSGSIRNASWEAQVAMAFVPWQQQNCPPSEQNIR